MAIFRQEIPLPIGDPPTRSYTIFSSVVPKTLSCESLFIHDLAADLANAKWLSEDAFPHHGFHAQPLSRCSKSQCFSIGNCCNQAITPTTDFRWHQREPVCQLFPYPQPQNPSRIVAEGPRSTICRHGAPIGPSRQVSKTRKPKLGKARSGHSGCCY